MVVRDTGGCGDFPGIGGQRQGGDFAAIAQGSVGDDRFSAASQQTGYQNVAGRGRARIILAVDDQHIPGLNLLYTLPLQVIAIRLGGHGAVGVDVFPCRDEPHGVGAPGEGFDVFAQGPQADQCWLTETEFEQLGGQRAAAATGEHGQHFIADRYLAVRGIVIRVSVLVDLRHSCSPGSVMQLKCSAHLDDYSRNLGLCFSVWSQVGFDAKT
ncbi:hypothetical protein D3C87_1490280 [compost metagenome]